MKYKDILKIKLQAKADMTSENINEYWETCKKIIQDANEETIGKESNAQRWTE